jgi:hypothetical protein
MSDCVEMIDSVRRFAKVALAGYRTKLRDEFGATFAC